MVLARRVGLMVGSAIAGALVAVYVHELLGVVPPTIVGVYLAVQAWREDQAQRAEIHRLEADLRPLAHPTLQERRVTDEDRRRRDRSARHAAGDDQPFTRPPF